ncbi:MAG TPA: hypothetical protein PLC54_01280 [Spirochaetales bacterium]|nr:hypothetical protein [Spirochaetales bacterium]
MAIDFDVYQVLKAFAARNKTSVIDYRLFAQAVQRQARAYDQTNPFYRDLSIHPESVLSPRLMQLAREKRISVLTAGNQIDRIYLPEAFTEAVYQEYRRMEENPDIPFPDETNLKLSVPSEWIQPVSVDTDLPALIDFEGDRPALLYRIMFPEGLRSIVILSVAVSDKLLEYAILKIRHYLRKGANKDFIQQRLLGALAGKELQLKETLVSIMIKPFDTLEAMKSGKSDFVYPFWAYLSSAVKKDLSGKGDPTPEDISVWQAAYLIDVYNNYYKGHAQREQDRESAFKSLELLLAKAPYLYSMQDITDFRDSQGRPFLGKYTREELEAWLADATTANDGTTLPKLLIVPVSPVRSLFIVRDKLLPYLVKALSDARPAVRTAITRDWQDVLLNFETLDAMNDDAAFRDDLRARLGKMAPVLSAVLDARLAPAVLAASDKAGDQSLERWFGNSRTAGMDVLLDLNRKRLLTDVRMMLPLWYTIPVFSWIMALWKRSAKKKAERTRALTKAIRADEGEKDQSKTAGNARATDFSLAAANAEKSFLPSGYKLEEYLGLLAERWNTLLDLRAKANLTEDINSLVRDYLRGALRSMKPSSFTPDRVKTMAANLADTPNLLKIRNHSALEEYIRLYMVKVLKR